MSRENREEQDENNKEYAENYARGRSGDFLRDSLNSLEDKDSIEYKAYKEGENDRSEHGWKSADDCGTGESEDKGLCFITSACMKAARLPDDCHELETLRRFREDYVAKVPGGEELIAEYRSTAPAVVRAIDQHPDGKQLYGQIYDEMVRPCVALIESGAGQAALDLYRDNFVRLRSALLPA